MKQANLGKSALTEFGKRLRIGLAVVVGALTGQWLAGHVEHHVSEFFSGGFLFGVIVSQYLFKLYDAYKKPSSSDRSP